MRHRRAASRHTILLVLVVGLLLASSFVLPVDEGPSAPAPRATHMFGHPAPSRGAASLGPLAARLSAADRPQASFASVATPTAASAKPTLFSVNSTLVLSNGSMMAGSFASVNFDFPESIAVDGPDGLLFVAEKGEPSVQVVNISRGLIVSTLAFPAHTSVTSLAYDPTDHLLYAVNNSSGGLVVLRTNGTHSYVGSVSLTGGGAGQRVEFDPWSGDILATEYLPNRLDVINATQRTIVQAFTVGSAAQAAVRAGPGGAIYVANAGSGSVSVLNTSTGVTWATAVGFNPLGVAYDPLSRTVWVTDGGATSQATLTLLNLTTNTTSTIATAGEPVGVVYDAVSGLVFVSVPGFGTQFNVSRFNGSTDRFVANTTLDNAPNFMALDPVTGELCVAPINTGNPAYELHVLAANGTFERDISAGGEPYYSTWLPNGNWIYAEDWYVSLSYLVNGSTPGLPKRGPGWEFGWDSAYDPQSGNVYVANGLGEPATVVNASSGKILARIWTKYSTTAAAYDPGTGRVFLGDTEAGQIAVVDSRTNSVVTNLSLGIPWTQAALAGLAVDPSLEELFAAEYNNATVVVFNTTTLQQVATFSFGGSPEYVTYDPGTGRLYVTGPYTMRVYDPRTGTELAAISLGSNVNAYEVVYSPGTGDLYVPNPANRSVIVVSPATDAIVANISLVAKAYTVAVDERTGVLFASIQSQGSMALVPTTASAPPWVASFTASPARIGPNGTVNLSATLDGGTTPYRFSYSGLPAGCSSRNESWVLCTPKHSGNFSIELSVVDAAGSGTNATVSFSEEPLPDVQITRVALSRDPIDLNVTTAITVDAIASYGALSYSYLGLPHGCITANTSTLPCAPDAVGSYQVEVRVLGAWNDTASANVTLDVVPRPALTRFSVSPASGEVGMNLTINVSVFGGVAPFQFRYTGLPIGCTSVDLPVLYCHPAAAGNASVTVTLTDSDGLSLVGHLLIPVTDRLAVTALEANPPAIDLGQSSRPAVAATGGVGALAYNYSGLPGGCVSIDAPQLACTPSSTGRFLVTVVVTDTLGVRGTAITTLAIQPVLTLGSLVASPDRIELGAKTSLSLTDSGGISPVHVSYSSLPPGCLSRDAVSVVCTPTQVGNYLVLATGTDATGATATVLGALEVAPVGTLAPTVASFGATNGTVVLGSPVTLVVRMTAAYPFTLSYGGLPAGCASTNTSQLTCVPTTIGRFSIEVNASSSWGATAHRNTTLVVLPRPSIPVGTGSSPPSSRIFAVAIAVAVVAVAALLVGVYWRTRRSRPPPTASVPPEAESGDEPTAPPESEVPPAEGGAA